jgi:hypothetical protein
MTEDLQIGAWLPDEWGRTFIDSEESLIADSEIDLLLVPENHDKWANRKQWKQLADDLDIAIYAGFKDGDWIRGVFYDPTTGTDFTYTKHSTANKLNLEREGWTPESELKTSEFRTTIIGTTICHDHYFSPFMGFEGAMGASLLVNLSARPVQRKKWGEVLQARAIENSAYVVCTMHGTERDGSSGGGNAHVFAFDPFGDQLALTEFVTGENRQLFDTKPDNIYTFTANPATATEAKRSLTDQTNRPAIQRIKTNVYDKPGTSETTVDVRVRDTNLELTYRGHTATIAGDTSRSVDLADEQFYIAAIEGPDLFEPERLYTDLLSVERIEDKTILIHNRWSDLQTHYIENVVEPVLRARTVEWASPTLLTSPTESRGYQAWYTKSTHQVPPDDDGRFNFDVRWATGVETALDPVNNRYDEMREVATGCRNRR